jgi:hypothetical protein
MHDSGLYLLEEGEQLRTFILREESGEKEDPKPGTEKEEKGDPVEGEKKKEEELIPQSKVNEIVGETRKTARETAKRKLLEMAGVATEDELVAALEEAKKIKESQMSEAERAEARIKDLEQASSLAEELKAQNEELQGAIQNTLNARMESADPPDYLKEVLRDMEPASALKFLTKHEKELAETRMRVPKTGASEKGAKKAETKEEKAERRANIAKTYGIEV